MATTLLATALPAQTLRIGVPLPPLELRTWVTAPVPDLQGALGTKIVLLAVETHDNAASWRAGLRTLALAQKRFGDAVLMLAITDRNARDATALADELGPHLRLPLAADPEAPAIDVLRNASRPSEPLAPCFLTDQHGRFVWHGPIDSDLDDRLDDLVHSRFDAAYAELVQRLEPALAAARQTRNWAQIVTLARPLVDQFAERAGGWTQTFDAWHTLARQRTQAHTVAVRAMRALADRPRELGAFLADSGIAAGALGAAFQADLLVTLEEAHRRAPEHCKILEAYFSVLSGSGDKAAATAIAARLIERVKNDAPRLALVAESFAAFDHDYGHFALLAIDLATHARPGDAELLERRFAILVRCTKDKAGTVEAGKRLIDAHRHDIDWLNSFAWDLLTEPDKKGRFPELALYGTEAMVAIADWENYWRLDTVALAKFENGDLAAAVHFQQRAVDSAAASARQRYQAKLDHYRTALERAPDK